MFGRYLKSQLMVLLCGGLVGPIFLIVYFMLGPLGQQYTEWMFYVGLLITVADVLIAVALARSSARSAAKTAALERNGVLVLAQITGMSETGTRINEQPLVRLDLHIAGPGFAFDTQNSVIASVTRMGNFSARKLVVLVDPATQDHQIDWERSALVNGLVPAQFTLSDENVTYDLSGQAGPLMEILQILKANGIPPNRMVDVRANPAVRQQIQAVVRRAVAQQTPAAPYQDAPASPCQDATPVDQPTSAVFTAPRHSTAQRLQELESLHAAGAITYDEYTAKRQQIISDL